MTGDKLKQVFTFYLKKIQAEYRWSPLEPKEMSDEDKKRRLIELPLRVREAHVAFMCAEAQKFVDEGRAEKAMRWLGYVQGYLSAFGWFTIDELRNHSKPPEEA